jgi:Transposase DDE domain group 1
VNVKRALDLGEWQLRHLPGSPGRKGAFSMPVSHGPPALDQLGVVFDDTHAVASAGLLPATLAERLGIQQTADQLIDLGQRPGAAHPGAKLLTLVHALVTGGDCIDDVDVLRCGSTSQVLGHRVLAPSTVGTFLRAFTFGHTRQLDRLTEQILTRAWAAGAGPADGPMTIDADSTIVEVHGQHKQGAAGRPTKPLDDQQSALSRQILRPAVPLCEHPHSVTRPRQQTSDRIRGSDALMARQVAGRIPGCGRALERCGVSVP